MCRGFKQDCPDGQLGKDKILEMYSMILPAGNAKERILLVPRFIPGFERLFLYFFRWEVLQIIAITICNIFNPFSVADPGSGAFLTPGYGIGDGKKVWIGIWDPG
jgi:hypothetical protein